MAKSKLGADEAVMVNIADVAPPNLTKIVVRFGASHTNRRRGTCNVIQGRTYEPGARYNVVFKGEVP